MSNTVWLRQTRQLLSRYKSRFLRLPRMYQVGGILVLSLIVVAGVLTALQRSPSLTPAQQVNKTYDKALTSLASSADQLPPKYWPEKSLTNDLDDYDSLLYQMQGDCNGLKSDYATMKTWELPKQTKANMDQVDRLCSDLIGVVKYSQDLYHAAHNYLFQDMSTWPDASQNYAFISRLNGTQQSSNSSKSSLGNVDSSVSNDPAMQELIATIDSTLVLAGKAQSAFDAGNTTVANDLGQQLSRKLVQDKYEFMNARTYYWNNTVQVGRLRQAIDQLNAVFQPPKAKKS